jgi:hypothetical protein
MKFVQSLYLFKEKDNTLWRPSDTDKHIWKLSNFYLNRLGHTCEFWGCEEGIKFAKNNGLKFTNIEKIPNLNINPRLWSIPKLYVASMQSEPFLHLDGDVFLKQWEIKKLPEFIVQNHEGWFSEKGHHWFYGFCSFLFRFGMNETASMLYDISNKCGTSIYNFGIFGGVNKILPSVCLDVFKMCQEFNEHVSKIPTNIFVPCVLEQIIVPMFMLKSGIMPTCYLNNDINKDAERLGFCHLIGPIKKKKSTIDAVVKRLEEFDLSD